MVEEQVRRHAITVRAILAGASLLILASPYQQADLIASSRSRAAGSASESDQEATRGASRQIEASLTLEPRAAAPGSAVKLLYMISSYEDKDENVRLRFDAGPGWTVLDAGVEKQELLLERWENIEGERYLVVPEDAIVGERQLVRLFVELIDDGGVIEAHDHVSVSRRGGAKPGVPTMSVTATAGVARLGAGGLAETERLSAVSVSTKFARQSTFSLFYDRGLRGQLSNFRSEEARTRVSGHLRHEGWDITFGNFISSPGQTLVGPYVLGRGAGVSRPAGRLMTELVVAQPNTTGGEAGGHVVRGRAGIRLPRLSVAFSASSFGRPSGGYTTLPRVQERVLNADEEERFEIERRLTATAASNRVTGLGVEGEVRPAPPHRFTFRVGALWLSNGAGTRAGGPAADVSYAYSATPGHVNVRWRDTPASVQGISIPGDELAVDGSLRVTGHAHLVAHAYRNTLDTVGSEYSSNGDGTSFGIRLTRGRGHLEVRGNYRDARFIERSVRRTVSVGLGAAVGPLSVTAQAELGTEDSGWGAGRLAFYRCEARWTQNSRSVTLSATHSQGFGGGRQRVDLMGTWKMREVELTGGAWLTGGYTSGGWPGAWTHVSLPIGGARFLIVAFDYSSPAWTASPTLRGMVAVRQGFTLPVPFVRGRPGLKQ